MSREKSGRRAHAAPRALGLGTAAALAALAATGCSWSTRHRPVREGERLVLPSAVVPAPAGGGWRVSRTAGENGRMLELAHGPGGAEDRWLTIAELESVEPAPARDALVADLSGAARESLRDPAARVEELPATAPAQLGPGAVSVALRAEQSTATAGVLERRVVSVGHLHVVSPGEAGRTLYLHLSEAATSDRPGRFAEDWEALLAGTEITPADRAHVAAAARADDFPKEFQPGLARRSLTLPRAGFQWALERHRWVEPGGFTGSAGLALGLTDHLQLDTPGFLRLSLGEAEALTRPEYAIGAGLTGVEHDAERGTSWTFGASFEARRRLGRDVAVQGILLPEVQHASRTRRTHAGGGASAGVVWDVDRLGLVSLGLEAGWARPADTTQRNGAWIGGLRTPLVTVHALWVDLGLLGAVAWNDGAPGIIAGASLLLTL
jgi:hypothetical protein